MARPAIGLAAIVKFGLAMSAADMPRETHRAAMGVHTRPLHINPF